MDWDNHSYNPPPREDVGPATLGFGLATLVLGAAIGALTALFFAPKSGQQLRSKVADVAGNWKEHAAEAIAQGRERVISAVETGRSEVPTDDERPGGQTQTRP